MRSPAIWPGQVNIMAIPIEKRICFYFPETRLQLLHKMVPRFVPIFLIYKIIIAIKI